MAQTPAVLPTRSTYPFVIERTRTTTLGGQRLASQRFVAELNTQSLADVRAVIRNQTIDAVAEQIALGNPPSVHEVDGKSDKPVEDVERKTQTVFGSVLPQAAMREVETALRAAIDAATRPHTGRLRDIAGAWQWRFLPAGGGTPRVVSAAGDLTFSQGDRLVLVPVGVPHATLANRNVAHSGRLNPKARMVRGKLREPAKRVQNAGFLFHAAEAVRRRTAFSLFHVKVVFTKAHMVPGEIMTRRSGTGMIQIRARVRRLVR